MKNKAIPCVLIVLCVLFSSCSINNRELLKEIDSILSNSPDAAEAILEKLKYLDIIFVATGSSHFLLNDTIFLSSNLQHLYNAGLRYFFVEGANDNSSIYGWSKEGDTAYPYYPWDYAGIRYGSFDLYHEIYQLNIDKNEQDKIKIIGLLTNMEEAIPGTINVTDWNNYRDEYMANIAINVIDNARQGEKILVLAGDDHGSKEIIPKAFGSKESWKPLGAYLNEKYKDRFFSLHYITLDENIKRVNDTISNRLFKSNERLINSNEWKNISNTQKLVTASNATNLRKLLPRLYLSGRNDNKGFDGFIVDKIGVKGVMFGYTLFDTDVLTYFIEQIKELDKVISLLKDEGLLENITANHYWKINYLVKYVYYLKLYFGDNFPYNFWNPKMPLREAIEILENNISEASKPEDKMGFSPPSMENLRDYHDHSYYFTSLLDDHWVFNMPASIKIWYEQQDIIKMKELFPYELWSEYWYAKIYTKGNKYEKAYGYLQIIKNNPLVYSMQIYPEVLEMTIQCAEKLGFNEQANNYRNQKASLWNEYSIDTGIFYLFN